MNYIPLVSTSCTPLNYIARTSQIRMIMKRLSLISILILAFCSHVNGQAKSIYFELGGAGLASFNFDTRFMKQENGLGARIGFGGFSIEGSGAAFLPVTLNYLLGKETRNYFELGVGITPLLTSVNGSGTNFTGSFGHLNFGYRFQPLKSGFLFRATITPVFGSWGFIPYWAGVSFGYKF